MRCGPATRRPTSVTYPTRRRWPIWSGGPGAVVPVSPPVAANVAEFYPETYRAAGSVDGTLYAAPLDGSVKSLVWFSPRVFAARGYRVPTDWGELLALSERSAADGHTPWCAAAGAGPAGGSPLVDALEDTLLGTAGPEVFDAWVGHTIPTDSPQLVTALDELGRIARNSAFVNGGIGDPASIASTPVAAGGLPILTGSCLLHRQADRYADAWPAGTDIFPGGDVFAFRLPPRTPDAGPTALVGGGFGRRSRTGARWRGCRPTCPPRRRPPRWPASSGRAG